MLSNLTGWHALVLLAVVVFMFGSTKLPALAKSAGESIRIFRKEVGPGTAADAGVIAAAPADVAAASAPVDRASPVPSTPERA